jgi:DNA processing protein
MVEESGSALAVLERETRERGNGQASLFADPAEPEPEHMLASATADIEHWLTHGMKLLTVLDHGYPENLRTVHDRPPLVFVSGDLRAEDARSVAVVGTREPSVAGAAEAAVVAEHLIDAGFTVVSGLAAGIDTAVHEASLARGGRTIAVIGTGLHRVYPPQNADLQRRISQAGAVISQFWPDAPPSRQSFPMRNAVMSGLTLGSVVVEATRTSGARVQARLALAHGRPVFLLRRLTQEDWGREFASRPGAHVVDEPAEITQIIARLSTAGVLSS